MIDFLKMLFQKYLHTYIGLLLGFILVFLSVVLPSDSFLEKGIPNFNIRLLVYVLVELIWFVCWIGYRFYLPKSTKQQVGLFLAIDTENDKQRIRIKNDLANGITKLLNENRLGETVHVIPLVDFRAQRVSVILDRYSVVKEKSKHDRKPDKSVKIAIENFKRLQKAIRANLFIWGTVKERKQEENKYFLNLNALVVHRPVDLQTKETIISEMLGIFPKEIALAEKIEFRGFQLASNILYIASLYIGGIAAYVSADPFTAYRLHHVLLKEFRKFNPLPPNLERVQGNLLQMLTLELHQQARYAYYSKRDSKKAIELLRTAEKISPKNYQVLIFLSLLSFEKNRNVREALEYINRAEENASDDHTWMYNKAFLLVYSGRFDEALSLYEQIENSSFVNEQNIVNQCIDFNQQILIIEPSRIQSHFVLGFLFYAKLKDMDKAREQLQIYLNKAARKNKHNSLVAKSREYLSRIQ